MRSDLDPLMQARNLDALLIFGDAEHNPSMYYFVGSGHVSGALLIKKVGKEPVLFYNDMEREEAAKSGLKTVSFSEFPMSEFEEQAKGDRLLANALRFEGIASDLDYAGRSAKGQFRQADRSGAAYAAIIGEYELERGVCTLRDMRSGEERTVPVADGAKELLRAVAG